MLQEQEKLRGGKGSRQVPSDCCGLPQLSQSSGNIRGKGRLCLSALCNTKSSKLLDEAKDFLSSLKATLVNESPGA